MDNVPSPEELLPHAAVLDLLNVCSRTVRRWTKNNGFPQPIIINGRKYWRRGAVNAWIDAQAGRHAA